MAQPNSCSLQEGSDPTYCVCNTCGYSEDYVPGSPCADKTCPTCGKPLTGANEKPTANARGQWAAMKGAFPEDVAFALMAFEQGLSVPAAKAEYAATLAERLKARDGEIAALKADVEKAKAENEGLKKQVLSGPAPLEHGPEPKPEGVVSVDAALAYQTEQKCSFADAYRAILAKAAQK